MSLSGRIRRTEVMMHALLLDNGYRALTRRGSRYAHATRPMVVVVERISSPALPIVAAVYDSGRLIARVERPSDLQRLLERGIA